jgi:hypothetical protein
MVGDESRTNNIGTHASGLNPPTAINRRVERAKSEKFDKPGVNQNVVTMWRRVEAGVRRH